MKDETFELIETCLRKIHDHKHSTNIMAISQLISDLASLSVSLGHQVSDAYALTNQLEDNYKIAYATFIKSYKGSVAKAEKDAESELGDLKKDWTSAKNGYKKLSVYLERIDKVIESYRQMISVTKLDLKNIPTS